MKRFPIEYRHETIANMFIVPHPKISDYFINCMATDGTLGWEHVSVSLSKKRLVTRDRRKYAGTTEVQRCPTWEEMCFVKSLFWNDDEAVMQLHPPKAEWISNHEFCLHLWKPTETTIPLPPSILVGIKTGR